MRGHTSLSPQGGAAYRAMVPSAPSTEGYARARLSSSKRSLALYREERRYIYEVHSDQCVATVDSAVQRVAGYKPGPQFCSIPHLGRGAVYGVPVGRPLVNTLPSPIVHRGGGLRGLLNDEQRIGARGAAAAMARTAAVVAEHGEEAALHGH